MHISMKAILRLSSFAFIVVFLCCYQAGAQTGNSGSIHGVVTDPTQAVVAGATVEIHNPVSGFSGTATTDGAGTFNVSTGAGILAAAAGAFVAKHGNEALGRRATEGLNLSRPDLSAAPRARGTRGECLRHHRRAPANGRWSHARILSPGNTHPCCRTLRLGVQSAALCGAYPAFQPWLGQVGPVERWGVARSLSGRCLPRHGRIAGARAIR